MIHEYELTDIWNKNLKELNGTMRLDSIIIRAMKEACIEHEKQINLSLGGVSGMFSAEQLEKAYNDGIEAEQQRCGHFDIENYC